MEDYTIIIEEYCTSAGQNFNVLNRIVKREEFGQVTNGFNVSYDKGIEISRNISNSFTGTETRKTGPITILKHSYYINKYSPEDIFLFGKHPDLFEGVYLAKITYYKKPGTFLYHKIEYTDNSGATYNICEQAAQKIRHLVAGTDQILKEVYLTGYTNTKEAVTVQEETLEIIKYFEEANRNLFEFIQENPEQNFNQDSGLEELSDSVESLSLNGKENIEISSDSNTR